jgi:AraC family transcriptional regulator, regulatory protein of adaptative response / methylated-DNA-[protein]-cysteine methyltransferase
MCEDITSESTGYSADKSTGIFCADGCADHPPGQKHAERYRTTKDALMDGYRPCTVCTPMHVPGETPADVDVLLAEIDGNPAMRIKEYDLVKRGMNPDAIRTWFQRHHDLTLQDYMRILRINLRFGTFTLGDTGCEETACDTTIVITKIPTPFCTMLAGATPRGICMLEFMDRRMLETQLGRLEKYFSSRLVCGTSPLFARLHTELEEYFRGARQVFDVPLDVKGTPFQETAWKALTAIPYGETRSYQDQAVAIGNPNAVRAVARANGDNRIGIIIPCHRVIGKDGSMTGYGGRIWRKEYLLNLESDQLEIGI